MTEGVFPKIDGDILYASDFNSVLVIGVILPWLKTYVAKSTGTATTDTTDKLVDTGATFITDGVEQDMIIYNSDDATYGLVASVDSETQITIAADSGSGSVVTDIFPNGSEAYTVYATPKLPAHWLEANGQTISDSASPYNGQVLPDLNGSSGTSRFLRGSTTSGTTGGAETHYHIMDKIATAQFPRIFDNGTNGTTFGGSVNYASTLPSYIEVVFIIKIK